MKKLSHIAGIEFIKHPSTIANCSNCLGYGFTGAPHVITQSGGWLPTFAFRDGIACSCPNGAWFADMQLRNLDATR